MGLATLKNHTAVPQSVVFKGRQIILDAHAEQAFDSELAAHFTSMRKPLVTEVQEPIDQFEDSPANMIWIANMTGNPDLPETINVRRWANRSWGYQDIPNPKREPIKVSRMMDGGNEGYTAKDGVFELKNLGAIAVTVAPFRRRLLPKNVAKWSLNRDSLASEEMRGCLIKSRAPSEFEPTASWPLDDVRSYFRLIDPRADVGKSEKEVRDVARANPDAAAAGESGELAYVDAAKRDLLNRVHFRIVDPQYTLPTRFEFVEFVSGKVPQSVSDADAIMGIIAASNKEVKKRRRGRPRKAAVKKVVAEAPVEEPVVAE